MLSCAFQYAKIAAEDGGTFDAYISVQQWLGTSLKLASNAPAVLSNYIALLGAAEAKKTIIWLAAFSITINALENQAISGHSSALSAIGKINIPSTGFATKPEDKKCTGAEPVNEDSVGSILEVYKLCVSCAHCSPALMPRVYLSRGRYRILHHRTTSCPSSTAMLIPRSLQMRNALVFSPFHPALVLRLGIKPGSTTNSSGFLMSSVVHQAFKIRILDFCHSEVIGYLRD